MSVGSGRNYLRVLDTEFLPPRDKSATMVLASGTEWFSLLISSINMSGNAQISTTSLPFSAGSYKQSSHYSQ